MLTPSAWKISQMAGTVGTLGVATFSAMHWKAMGGYWQNIHQIVPNANDDSPFVGDCFEVVVPKSYLVLLNKSSDEDDDDDDEVAIFARAFFTAPCFTLEQRLIQFILLSTKESETTTPIEKEQFPIGSQQCAWQVIARQPHQFIQMEWGTKSIGGTTNFATGPGPSPDLRTLRFGSTISVDNKLHPTMLWFHEQYSKLLLAQTANRLKVQASASSSSST
jgi:hypothetical protein